MTDSAMLSEALAYARLGVPVFPCHSIANGTCTCSNPECDRQGKHPRTANGLKDASTDESAIRAWWTRWPRANVAARTGSVSGWVAIDVDPGHGGTVAALENDHGPLPVTVQQRTGSGGLHLLYRHPGGVELKNSTSKLAPGVDTRGDGGYIVLPPSVHVSGNRYAWEAGFGLGDIPLAPLPVWIVDTLRPPQKKHRSSASNAPPPGSRYVEAAVERECAAVASAVAGRRNATLNASAFSLGQLVGSGALDRRRAEDALLAAALRCELPEYEAIKTIANGLDAGEQEPRSVPTNGAPNFASASAREGREDGRASRPIVKVRLELNQVTAEYEQALLALGGTYQRGRGLVRVTREAQKARGLKRAAGSPLIALLTVPAIRGAMDRAATSQQFNKQAKDWVGCLPPTWAAETLLARGEWSFPVLEAVVESPTFRPDGTVLNTPGYDEVTGLLYLPNAEFPPAPNAPTPDDARRALVQLLGPLAEFPWVEACDRAAAVATILAIAGRHAVCGPVPLSAVRANVPGAGKGLLVEAMCRIGSGREPTLVTYPREPDEMRKRVMSLALGGDRVVVLDNVDRPLGDDVLAAALTAGTWSDRAFHTQTMVSAPLRSIWLATGNGLAFRGDTGRRVLPIDIDPGCEYPEDRRFKVENLLGWVEECRPALLIAALTILRGFHCAGRPRHGGSRIGSFESWDDLIRSAVVWVGLPDPALGRKRIRDEDDSDIAALRQALIACQRAYGEEAFTVAELIHRASPSGEKEDSLDSELREALVGLLEGAKLDGHKLGQRLRAVRGRIIGGLKFTQTSTRATGGVARWRVVRTERVSP